jgi:hypothetical protein
MSVAGPIPSAPLGSFYISATQSLVSAWATTVDASQGYPRAGVDIGGGLHVSVLDGTTYRYASVYQHPTLSMWAYLSDATTVAALAATAGKPIPTQLDATWIGAITV